MPTAYDILTAYAALGAPWTKAFRLPPAAKAKHNEFYRSGPAPA